LIEIHKIFVVTSCVVDCQSWKDRKQEAPTVTCKDKIYFSQSTITTNLDVITIKLCFVHPTMRGKAPKDISLAITDYHHARTFIRDVFAHGSKALPMEAAVEQWLPWRSQIRREALVESQY
jgi:hypothetical protein